MGSASPVTIADDVLQNFGPMGALYAVSNANTLAYVPAAGGRRLVGVALGVDRSARTRVILSPAPPRNYEFPALSPDGRQIAVPIVSRAL